VTASARRYRKRSSHDATAITFGLVITPSSTATSGNTSWMLNTNGTPRRAAASQPDTPSGSGGDMTITASARPREPSAANVAAPVNPANPSARAAMFALSVGNGCRRVMCPHGIASVRHGRPRHSGSTSWRRYQGREVTTCRRWPRAASASTMAVITSPVGATSGA
jgi:hypothetical protein